MEMIANYLIWRYLRPWMRPILNMILEENYNLQAEQRKMRWKDNALGCWIHAEFKNGNDVPWFKNFGLHHGIYVYDIVGLNDWLFKWITIFFSIFKILLISLISLRQFFLLGQHLMG